jgi:hypothetical protein
VLYSYKDTASQNSNEVAKSSAIMQKLADAAHLIEILKAEEGDSLLLTKATELAESRVKTDSFSNLKQRMSRAKDVLVHRGVILSEKRGKNVHLIKTQMF